MEIANALMDGHHGGRTLESHGSKGPNRRPWNKPILKQIVKKCYKLAQLYVMEVGPAFVMPA